MLGNVLAALVALLQTFFMILEMYFWDKPFGRQIFGLRREFASATKVLAANQGLYNGFLAAGLMWGLYLGSDGEAIRFFFLMCVLVAGVFGAATSNTEILFVQATPAALALVFSSW
jgi:putative membrane protein